MATTAAKPTIGILGGGQLARMLIQAADPLGIDVVLFTDDAHGSAAQVAQPGNVVTGSLPEFFSRAKLVLFENEFVDCDRLRAAATGNDVTFVPALDVIARLQDKLSQKKLLVALGIPTAPFIEIGNIAAAGPAGPALTALFSDDAVLKWSRMGYDGKGVFILPNGASAEKLRAAEAFINAATKRGIPVYAEQKIAFRRELALVATYSRSGDFVFYPLVVTEQQSGICKLVTGPATALGVPAALEKEAAADARKLAEHVGLHGTFAIEFFETQDGRLLVNEIAPRVHNSGHFTIDAAETSQFANHLLAALGRKPGSTKTAPAFAMLNLLGPAGLTKPVSGAIPPATAAGHFAHWYGKSSIAADRKVGHVNARAASPGELPAALAALGDCDTKWTQAVLAAAEKDAP